MARVITVDLDRLDDLAGAAMAGYSHHVATARVSHLTGEARTNRITHLLAQEAS